MVPFESGVQRAGIPHAPRRASDFQPGNQVATRRRAKSSGPKENVYSRNLVGNMWFFAARALGNRVKGRIVLLS